MNTEVSTKMKLVSFGLAAWLGLVQYLFISETVQLIAIHIMAKGYFVNLGITGILLDFIHVLIRSILYLPFSFPVAYLLLKLRPERTVLYVLVAVIPMFVLMNTNFLNYSAMHYLSWIPQLLPLPVAVYLLKNWLGGDSSNKSLNPEASAAGSG